MYKNILAPVDLEYPEAAAESLNVARGIARANGATLTVISILPALMDDSSDPDGKHRSQLEAFLAERVAPGEVKDIIEVSGSISAEIRSAAREVGADLVVMGARDAEFTETMIGSNAAHVVLHTPCSVLLVQ